MTILALEFSGSLCISGTQGSIFPGLLCQLLLTHVFPASLNFVGFSVGCHGLACPLFSCGFTPSLLLYSRIRGLPEESRYKHKFSSYVLPALSLKCSRYAVINIQSLLTIPFNRVYADIEENRGTVLLNKFPKVAYPKLSSLTHYAILGHKMTFTEIILSSFKDVFNISKYKEIKISCYSLISKV